MNALEEIKKKIDIVDFISSFIPVKKAGRNFKACCPFHNEKTPSFLISPDRQIWHCFGACNDGGDIVKFLMKLEGITFYEALKKLAEKANVKLDNVDFEDKTWKIKERLFSINNLAADYYNYLLTKHKIGEKALLYLKNRSISDKIINSFNLGYSPDSWDSLLLFLKNKGFKEEEILRSGLIIKSERGKYYDRFRKRLMFPLKDPNNNILGFSGRIIEKKETDAKYINTPETEIYHKRETLFGINLTKDNIRKKNNAIITEGEFDMISCFANGLDNSVAVKGAAVTHEQLKLLKRYTKKIILCLDSDASGEETTKRTIQDAEELDFEIFVASIDFAKDPDEALKKDPISFKKAIKNSLPIYDFIINHTVKKYQNINDPFVKKNVAEEIIPYLIKIKNPIVKGHYIKILSEIINTSILDIEKLIKQKFQNRKNFYKPKIKINGEQRNEILEKYILSSLFQNENPPLFFEKIKDLIEINDFSIMAHQKLYSNFTEYNKQNNTFSIEQFIQFIPKELIETFDKILLFDIDYFANSIKENNFKKISLEIKKATIKIKISELFRNIGEEKNEKLENEIKELNQKLSAIEKSLTIL